jgi:pimeloyl-ACP methyl ester carboxylesterase
MNEKLATNVGPARLDLAWEERGDRKRPTVLLVMGLASQLIHWPPGFLDALVARSMHVVTFDNRDVGRSTHLRDAPVPDFAAAMKGDLSSVSYTLSDMAKDGVGLLDALGIQTAHVAGASMGAGIAQTMALEHPSRIKSLTSMMWTTGDPSVGQMHPATMKAVFGGPPPRTREEAVARAVERADVVGSPAFPSDAETVAQLAALAYDRGHDELAPARQGIAVIASGDRTERLRKLDLPALVVHGLADTMVDPSGGRATAAAIPAAQLMLIDGMGHHLPAEVWGQIADAIAEIVKRGEARAFSDAGS